MGVQKTRPSIPKTKTFAGCWTCRRRKVKCDNVRPRCNRCAKDFHCEGYDIELFWMPTGNDSEARPQQVKRKAMLLLDERLPKSCNVAEVHDMLIALEEAELKLGLLAEVGLGPFCIFPACPQSWNVSQSFIAGLCSDGQSEIAAEACQMYIESDPSMHATTDDEYHAIASLGASNADFESDILTASRDSGFPPGRWAPPNPFDLDIRSNLYTNKSAGELMHNYITIVADLLQPVYHYQNPYKSIYVPNGIIGSANLLTGMSFLEPSHSHEAVFHAILSVSAFHLRGTENKPERSSFDKLGRFHRGKAFTSLQKALMDNLSTSDYHAAMSAMLSLVSADLMDGGMTEFWIHLDGCERLQRMTPDDLTIHSSNKQLHNICSFMTTLARSTEPEITPLPWLHWNTALDLGTDFSFPFDLHDSSLEFTYGITASLAAFIHKITKISRHIRYYSAINSPMPESLVTAVSNLYRGISSWSLAQERFSSINYMEYDTIAIIQHHAVAFHNAIRIYFHTRLNVPSSISMNLYCQSTLENLMVAETQKMEHGSRYGWNLMAPIVWPGFIASCEADPADRCVWRAWWESVQKYRIGSIARLWYVVLEVWNARDAGSVDVPGWVPILREKGIRVISGG